MPGRVAKESTGRKQEGFNRVFALRCRNVWTSQQSWGLPEEAIPSNHLCPLVVLIPTHTHCPDGCGFGDKLQNRLSSVQLLISVLTGSVTCIQPRAGILKRFISFFKKINYILIKNGFAITECYCWFDGCFILLYLWRFHLPLWERDL